MKLKWIFIILLMAYTLDAFSSVDGFQEIIADNTISQTKLAAEIQRLLGIKHEKTLQNMTDIESVALKGYNLRVY